MALLTMCINDVGGAAVDDRDCQGFSNPPRVRGRVGWGKGKGWDFHTLAKPLPLAKVKGIYNDKNICIYHIYLLLNKYFSI